MHRSIIFSAVVLALSVASCHSDKTHTTASSFDSSKTVDHTIAAAQANTTSNINPDSLPVRKVGELVLNGTLIPSDNTFTFKLMDSLQSADKESRRFYFSVFNKIMDRADGALGEAIGDYAVTYVEQFPAEFIEFSKGFSEDRFEAWAGNVGIELSLSANDAKEGYKNFSDLLMTNCKGCDKATIDRLKQFNKLVWQAVKENMNSHEGSE